MSSELQLPTTYVKYEFSTYLIAILTVTSLFFLPLDKHTATAVVYVYSVTSLL